MGKWWKPELLWSGTIRKTINNPSIPAHLASFHRIYVAKMVIVGAAHSECKYEMASSNLFTSFESRLASFPGAVSLKALCDSCNDCNYHCNYHCLIVVIR